MPASDNGNSGVPSLSLVLIFKVLLEFFIWGRIPYFTFSPTFSSCMEHGYIAGEHFTCPKCGSDCEVFSRVVGYIRPVKQWNEGKKTEFKKRKTFVIQDNKCCC